MFNREINFEVITGDFINKVIETSRRDIIELVRQSYLTHHQGKTENPDSYFLRFKNKPEARIIALPAAIDNPESDISVSGIKWIASYPRNIEANLQRASAVILLNDYRTGYPFSCLEASQISAARTAASAVLAANYLGPSGKRAKSLSVIGSGLIARTILSFFKDEGWQFDNVLIYDISEEYRDAFIRNTKAKALYPVRAAKDQAEALSADIVIFATTAASPYVTDERTFAAHQFVLNISLRDLSPEIIHAHNNVLDDVEHCMKANTSPHLAEQKYGHRLFINGTLAQFINGEIKLDKTKATLFSPFGLGVLDLSLAMFIYRHNQQAPGRHIIPSFFPDTQCWSL
ncbi:2,3-diaminopropionate biosynthesis protein SbnB [Fluviispira multicolorata]|uniref:2,3-diaminopropionate biosynthesis protein SbnB n=1 Tax=Fluviispira multicolorata TaxID=2654512 RepID=A0A833JBM6_9BACT|nr:2,3-diaminopropionate biosynthesis protein SbnB [Fluviispira multicolorata]KAB8029693.1 2,3-diaminopropionate biosynthesis protein SbnB [Fluviispira multicolorata]